MAIKEMSSQDFNNILETTQEKILTMNNNIVSIKDEMATKLNVINHEIVYLNKSMDELKHATEQDGVYVLLDNNNHGLYSTYCNNVHQHFKKEPVNIFNVKPINSTDIYFKDEAKVSINGVENDHYKNILKEDSVTNKKIFFDEYVKDAIIKTDSAGKSYIDGTNTITLSISIDQLKAYGITKFNMIEIDPFLMKSFDITSINIYDSVTSIPAKVVSVLEGVGKTRIILDKKYTFKKVEFVIEPKYSLIKNGVETIPFGLKHIYFYDADFRNDSYIDVTYESEEFLDYVNNKVILYTPTGAVTSTLTEQGIKIYLDNINGILGSELEPTDNIRKVISRNLKKIYFRIPLGIAKDTISATSTIYAMKFFIESR